VVRDRSHRRGGDRGAGAERGQESGTERGPDGHDPDHDRERGRGQLILVGGLTLAFVVISLALVFNGLTFADSLAPSRHVETLDAAERFDRSAVDGSRTLVLYANHAAPHDDRSDLNDSIRAQVATYSRLRAESHAASHSGTVGVRYHGIETDGSRVMQATDGNFTDTGTVSGAGDWTPVSARDVGWFVINLDAPNVSADEVDRFHVTVTDTNGDSATLFVNRNTSTGADSATIDVETDLPGATNDTARRACAPSQDRLLLDLRAGQAYGGYCAFNLTGPLDPPYTVTFTNGEKAVGKYAVVVDAAPGSLSNGLGTCPGSGPCNAWAAWRVTLTTTYDSREVAYGHTQNATVYP
jgi:hypothetical protein